MEASQKIDIPVARCSSVLSVSSHGSTMLMAPPPSQCSLKCSSHFLSSIEIIESPCLAPSKTRLRSLDDMSALVRALSLSLDSSTQEDPEFGIFVLDEDICSGDEANETD